MPKKEVVLNTQQHDSVQTWMRQEFDNCLAAERALLNILHSDSHPAYNPLREWWCARDETVDSTTFTEIEIEVCGSIFFLYGSNLFDAQLVFVVSDNKRTRTPAKPAFGMVFDHPNSSLDDPLQLPPLPPTPKRTPSTRRPVVKEIKKKAARRKEQDQCEKPLQNYFLQVDASSAATSAPSTSFARPASPPIQINSEEDEESEVMQLSPAQAVKVKKRKAKPSYKDISDSEDEMQPSAKKRKGIKVRLKDVQSRLLILHSRQRKELSWSFLLGNPTSKPVQSGRASWSRLA